MYYITSVITLLLSHFTLSHGFLPTCRIISSPNYFTHTHLNSASQLSDSKESIDPNIEISGKSITKEIMSFFAEKKPNLESDQSFRNRLKSFEVFNKLDGMHMITLLFQSARARRRVKNFIPLEDMLLKLQEWNKEWSERDISTFLYGIYSLECVDEIDGKLLKLAAKKISESSAILSSRSIGNSLYGLHGITTDTLGAPELCQALAGKIKLFQGDLNGQDIGIGIYGLQGYSLYLFYQKKKHKNFIKKYIF